jgi:1-aminocyclopropane-1-carboxylate deaminase/D-cysteine desulfhydrase-like pyridoxal-dependent ACC family enzyme
MPSFESPRIALIEEPTPLHEMAGLREELGGGPRLLVKRDDVIPFGFGGNKVRKLEYALVEAVDAGADTLVTLGGIQSNHARATAAAAATLGMKCVLIINGSPQQRPTGNALLENILGAEIEYISGRAERASATERVIERLRQEGRNPFFLPLGASTSIGAIGFLNAIGELVGQGVKPDVIVHAGSSGGTQAGLVAGAAILRLDTRIIAVSADDPADEIRSAVTGIVRGIDDMGDFEGELEVDDTRVGEGYGIPTEASREAQMLAARREGFFVDHTYTGKALGALISYVREGRFSPDQTVLFWHTGGQASIFA